MENETWNKGIAACIEQESKRFMLKSIPLWLIASVEYNPDLIDWIEYQNMLRN